LPAGRCGLVETAHVLDYLAAESAGQCGPCRYGLPRLASTFSWLGRADRDVRLANQVEYLIAAVDGRGACRHPDGTAHLVRSALRTFAGEVGLHLEGRCSIR
jgi:NADH:ubiquinone oxidoreductase subunit F (NADH-binding)